MHSEYDRKKYDDIDVEAHFRRASEIQWFSARKMIVADDSILSCDMSVGLRVCV